MVCGVHHIRSRHYKIGTKPRLEGALCVCMRIPAWCVCDVRVCVCVRACLYVRACVFDMCTVRTSKGCPLVVYINPVENHFPISTDVVARPPVVRKPCLSWVWNLVNEVFGYVMCLVM